MKVALRSVLCLFLSLPLWAHSSLRLDFASLTQAADRVVGGRITNISSARDARSGYIYSTVTMQVTQAFPAALAGREFSFRMVGGAVGARKTFIAGYPEFRVGDEVILFLQGQTSSVFGPTVGLQQGVFFVEKDKQTGVERVTDYMRRPVLGIRDAKIIRGLRRQTDATTKALTAPGEQRWGLRINEFFNEVRTYRVLSAPQAQ